jgi:NADH-quinone oxidoreductase subunit C
MTFADIAHIVSEQFGLEVIVKITDTGLQPSLTIQSVSIAVVCSFLKNDDRLFFDQLSCLTAIDNGIEANTLEVIYHLNSIPYQHSLVLKTIVERTDTATIPSVTTVWRTADWHEREAYDLVGICFDNHPDLRRILLPTDWQGHPLRKDYQTPETYHGIKVDY